MNRHSPKLATLSFVTCLIASLAFTLTASAATETMLHVFSPKPNGAASEAGMIADAAGNLYGTTTVGADFGVVFRLSRNSHGTWNQTVLHNFTGGNSGPDGETPAGGLIADAAGNLYGATRGGGTYGCGVVYKLAPATTGPWKETILHSFGCYPSDGNRPNGSLTLDSAGNLYGTTTIGGSGECGDGYSVYGCGMIYELSPGTGGYTETVIYSFSPSNNFESNPAGPVAFDKSGNLYGTASVGGDVSCTFYGGCGTVFKLTKDSSGWTESTIYNFTGTTDGDTPGTGVVVDASGNLFGTTLGYYTYGSVFELSPNSDGSYTETTLYLSNPGLWSLYGAPTFDPAGNIYVGEVVNSAGGCSGSYCGQVIKISHSSSGWTSTILYGFTGGKDGQQPYGTLLRDSTGSLYTTTIAGANGAGAIVKLSPAANFWKSTILYDFPVLTEGTVPYSGLLADGEGNYFGTTTNGGTSTSGTVYELSPNGSGGWKETIIYNFTGANGTGDGYYPLGNLIRDVAGNIYGTTQYGGKPSSGCFDLNVNECGTVFKLAPNGNGTWSETVLYSFTGYTTGDGSYPQAGLYLDSSSGNLYGTTHYGGAKDCGTAFVLTPNSGAYIETILYTFGASFGDACNPSGPLVRDSQGNFYSSANANSSNSYATVFKLSPSGGGYTESVIFTFNTTNSGAFPEGGVILDASDNLYGTAYQGGLYNSGLVYKLTPSAGTYTQTVLRYFTGVNGDGGFPWGQLTFDSAGNLFGTTTFGGLENGSCVIGCGTVFELSPNSNGTWRETVLHRFTAGMDGSQPYSSVTIDGSGNVLGTASASGPGNSGIAFEIKP